MISDNFLLALRTIAYLLDAEYLELAQYFMGLDGFVHYNRFIDKYNMIKL